MAGINTTYYGTNGTKATGSTYGSSKTTATSGSNAKTDTNKTNKSVNAPKKNELDSYTFSSKNSSNISNNTNKTSTQPTSYTSSTSGSKNTANPFASSSTTTTKSNNTFGSLTTSNRTGSTNATSYVASTSASSQTKSTEKTTDVNKTGSTRATSYIASTSASSQTKPTEKTTDVNKTGSTRATSYVASTAASNQTNTAAGTNKTNSVTAPSNTAVVKEIEKEVLLDLDSDINKAIKYEDSDSVAWEMESLLYKNPTANPVDIIQAGGAQFLLNMSNTTKGNGNMSAFLPEEDQITEEYVNIVSAAWENLSEEEKNNQGNSYLKQLYDQTYNHIVSKSSNPELFKAYARQMGMVDDAGWDSNHQMTLEEMLKGVNTFNEMYKNDPNFMNGFVTQRNWVGGTYFEMSDAQRQEFMLKYGIENTFDSNYTMQNAEALQWQSDDSFFEKFGKGVESLDFVQNGGWKNYNTLNKEYIECQALIEQYNQNGTVVFEGKTFDSSNAEAFVNALNMKVDSIQKQKEEIEQTEAYDAAVATAGAEFGWTATKFALNFVPGAGSVVTASTMVADGLITTHDSLADGNSLDEAIIDGCVNVIGCYVGNKVTDSMGNYLFETSSIPAPARQNQEILKDWLFKEGYNFSEGAISTLWTKVKFDAANEIQSLVENPDDYVKEKLQQGINTVKS